VMRLLDEQMVQMGTVTDGGSPDDPGMTLGHVVAEGVKSPSRAMA
jgi:hypothetical protein